MAAFCANYKAAIGGMISVLRQSSVNAEKERACCPALCPPFRYVLFPGVFFDSYGKYLYGKFRKVTARGFDPPVEETCP